MDNKKKIIASVIGIIILLVMVVGVTYAMYTYTGTGSKENVITTGNISVSYAESKVVNLENTYPMSDALGIQGTESSEMKFTVTGNITGNVTINYAIGLDAIEEGETLKDEYVKIYMLKGNEVVSTFTEGVGTLISELEQNYVDGQLGSYALYTDSFTEEGITSQEYTIKAWVSEEYDLPGDDETKVGDTISKGTTSETFKFKIKVVATDQRLVIGNDNVGPTIESFTHLGDGVINVVANDASGLNGICINNNATDVTGCSWETYTTGTYEGELSTSGTYYAHVKDTIGNISHSNALGALDISGANMPELATGMIPVYYDETCNSNAGCWRKADDTNSNTTYKWYDYGSHMWANAVTVTEVNSSRADLTGANLGTEIPMSRINTMLVWIPRFSAVVPTTPGEGNETVIDVTFVDKNTEALDAFTFDGAKAGIWVGKFELGHTTLGTSTTANNLRCTSTTCSTSNGLQVKPNVNSLKYNNVSNFFYAMRNMEVAGNAFGLIASEVDTHMMKNSEWGAVAYLTQSNYGRCTNNVCTDIGINNNSGHMTGYGAPAGSDTTVTNGTYETALGQDASTTGNIYGIYDMSGGSWEYVMGNFDNTIGLSGFSSIPESKYINIYIGTTYQGHALSETIGWYTGSSSGLVFADSPWFARGGFNGSSGKAGVFRFYNGGHLSGSSDLGGGTRLTIIK